MVTADRVKAKLQGLITAANTKTGNSDADLTTAVNTLIDGFQQGGVKLPEIDESVLGSADDLASGKQLIDDDGNVVTGSVAEYDYQVGWKDRIPTIDGDSDIKFSINTTVPYLFRKGVYLSSPLSNFGDATAADVAKGKTFTSANGLKVTGTHECEKGVEFPTLTTPGAADDLASGKQLIDANGNVVKGTLTESKPDDGTMGFTGYVNPEIFINTPGGEPHLNISAQVQMSKIVRKDARVCTRAPLSMFGDATAADVAKGKTFTSDNGLTVEGTNTFRDIKTITIKEM